MSDAEKFLSRWSRRKREAAGASPRPPGEVSPPKHSEGRAGEGDASHESVERARDPGHLVASRGDGDAAAGAPPAFDPASLPPIESITAGTDIRAFLQAGVPVELTRAALRRAWSTDPAIRDFVGLAENAWDFTAPAGVPGFEPLRATDDVRRLAAQVFGGDQSAAEEAEQKTVATRIPEHQAMGEAETPPPKGDDRPSQQGPGEASATDAGPADGVRPSLGGKA